MSYTRGPWSIENTTDIFGPNGGDSGDGVKAHHSDAWQVAAVGYYKAFVDNDLIELGEDVRKSNARLIASAPELLEALENCVDLLSSAEIQGSVTIKGMTEIIRDSGRVIKKAKGGRND